MKKMIVAAALSVFIAMASLVAFTQAADRAARTDLDMANTHKVQSAKKNGNYKADNKATAKIAMAATMKTAEAAR